MPAPGPGGSFYDDFEGNKLSSKWVATRISQGGQNTGVWSRVIKDSKVQWDGVNASTESSWWGEKLTLPVNAPGDITIEAMIRQKWYGGGGLNSSFAVGFNTAPGVIASYGGGMSLAGVSSNYRHGYNAGGLTPFPGFPSQLYVSNLGVDILSKIFIVRKNGYVFLYIEGTYVGQYAYAAAITSVDIVASWQSGAIACYKTCDYIRVAPREVVL